MSYDCYHQDLEVQNSGALEKQQKHAIRISSKHRWLFTSTTGFFGALVPSEVPSPRSKGVRILGLS